MAISRETEDRQQRFEAVLADYLQAVEAGQPPDQHLLLAQHPDLASELASFFANRAEFAQLAQQAAPPALPTADLSTPAANCDTATPTPSVVGRTFGDYELLGEIARGGMGIVYRARQISLNRTVAVKMILAGQLAGEDDVRRFRTEAQAAASLDHPCIVPIHEVGEHDGQYFFSMKFIEGGSLASRMKELRRDPKRAVRLLANVARAVHHAHQRGIMHRDLKPANILVDKQGRPHVTDFGLAKHLRTGPGMTQSGAIIGTPSYMAPEQATAQKQLTTAVDVYSLGAILYELLTGRPPFQAATTLETLQQVVGQEPQTPRSLNPLVNRDLETIALKCLAKDPAMRYGSAEKLAEELERYQRGEPILARPVGSWIRLWRWGRRHPVLRFAAVTSIMAFVGFVVLLAIFGTTIYWQWRMNHRDALIHSAAMEREAGNREQSLALLKEAAGIWKDDELRSEAILAVTKTNLRPAGDLVVQDQYPRTGTTWELSSSDGHKVRTVIGNKLREHSFPSGELLREETLAPDALPLELKLSVPTGMRLLGATRDGKLAVLRWLGPVAGPQPVRLWDMAQDKELAALPDAVAVGNTVMLSPDGRRMAVSDLLSPNLVRIWDWQAGRFVANLTAPGWTGLSQYYHQAGFSPDGTLLSFNIFRNGEYQVGVWEVETGRFVWSWAATAPRVIWSDDGRWLVSLGGYAIQDGQNWKHVFANLHEVIHHNPTYLLPTATRSVTFAPERDYLEDGRTIWKMNHAGDRYWLTTFATIRPRESAFFCRGGEVWTVNTDYYGYSGETNIILHQLAPQVRTLELVNPGYDDPKLHVPGVQTVPRPCFVTPSPDGKQLVIVFYHNHLTGIVPRRREASTETNGEWTLELWDREQKKRLAIWNTDDYHESFGRPVYLSDGRRVATQSSRGVKIWDIATGKVEQTLLVKNGVLTASVVRASENPNSDAFLVKNTMVPPIRFLDDNTRYTVPSTSNEVFDLATGQRVGTLRGNPLHRACDINPGVTMEAFATEKNEIELWDVGANKVLAKWRAHDSQIQVLCFSPNGDVLVSVDKGGVLRLWNLPWIRKELAALGLDW